MNENILKEFLYQKKKEVFLATGGILVASLLSTPVPYINGFIIDNIFLNHSPKETFIHCIIVVLLLLLIRYILLIYCEMIFSRLNTECTKYLRTSLFEKTLRFPVQYFEQYREGYISSRISESDNVARIFAPNIIMIFLGIVDLCISILILTYLNIRIAIITVTLYLLYVTVAHILSIKIEECVKTVHEENASVTQNLCDSLEYEKEIKIANDYKRHIQKFIKVLEKYLCQYYKQYRLMVIYTETTSLFTSLMALLILLICGIAILQNDMTIGMYTTLAGYATKIFSNIRNLANMNVVLKPIRVSLKRVNEYMSEVEELSGDEDIQAIKKITVEKVCYSYDKKSRGLDLKEIEFNLCEGDVCIIEGANGSGKSTLIELMLGLRQVTKGNIYYNNILLDKIDKRRLRSKIAVATQFGYFIEGTVFDNIVLLNKDVTKDNIENILEKKQLLEIMRRLGKKLESNVAAGGRNLSAGQKQIISFLRAVIAERDVLILDEITSNMDVELKKIVSELLKNSNYANLILIISHDEIFPYVKKRIRLK